MIIGQKAIIKKGDRYLILHKSKTVPRFSEYWDFPGGSLDEGEDPIDGLKREVREETKLVVLVGKLLWKKELDIGDTVVKYRVYETELVPGEVQLSDEHTEFRWVTKQELVQLKIQPYIKDFLSEYKL